MNSLPIPRARASAPTKSAAAAVIVMQLRYRNGMPLYGKTLQSVLGERPCRVIVVAEPKTARDGAAAVSASAAPV